MSAGPFRRPRTLLVVIAGALSTAGCGGLATPGDLSEAPPVEGAEVEPSIDLHRVAWPMTPEPLPEGLPWWANGFSAGRGATPRHATGFENALEWMSSADTSLTGDLEPTVVFCRLHYAGADHDPRPVFRGPRRARADLMVSGRIGGGHEFSASAPNNTTVLGFGAPTPALRVGDAIVLSVRDRDFIRHDSVGTLSVTYEGRFPLELTQGALSLRCVALAPATVSGREPALLRDADMALATVMAARPSPDEVPYVSFERFEVAREAVAAAATWLSWSHAGVQLRRARLDALLDAHEEAQRAAHAALVETLADRAEQTLPSGATLRRVGIVCERASNGIPHCYARFVLEGSAGYSAGYTRIYTVTKASARALPRFVRLEGGARLYEVDLREFFPHGRADGGPAAVVLEFFESSAGPGVRLVLTHVPEASGEALPAAAPP